MLVDPNPIFQSAKKTVKWIRSDNLTDTLANQTLMYLLDVYLI